MGSKRHVNFFDNHSLDRYVTSQGAISFADFIQQTSDKKNPAMNTTSSIIQYPTGYMYLDYAAGSYLTVHDPKDGEPMFMYHNIGIAGGQFITVIGKSQVGKTSVSLSLAAGVIEPYISQWRYAQAVEDLCKSQGIKVPELENYPVIEIMDSEHTTSIDYTRKVCRYTAKLSERHLRITDVVTDRDLMQALKKHIEYKVQCFNKVPMPMVDSMNRPVMHYPPTVIIIDSLTNMLMEDAPEGMPVDSKDKKKDMISIYESAVQNTAGARKAKTVGALISYLVDYAKKYNILFLSVSHITNMLPGPTGIPMKAAFFLKPGENVSSGGVKGLYLSSSILRLDFYKGIGTEKATQINLGEGISGRVVLGAWAKCKTNSQTHQCKLAYTNVSGYDPLLSCIIQDKEDDALCKAGNFYYLRDYPDYKFSMKNYSEIFAEHPEMFTAYYDEVKERASRYLDNADEIESRNQKFLEKARKDIHDSYGDGSRSDREDMMDLDDLLMSVTND